MGRKSVVKYRTNNAQKTDQWVRKITPFLMQNGFKNSTMDSLAQFLGKSKATIYKYFSSREEIVAAIIVHHIEELCQFVPILQDQSAPHEQRYRKAVEFISKELIQISSLFLADVKAIYPHLWDLIDAFRDESLHVLDAFYRDGIAKGVFNNFNPVILTLSDQLFFDALTNPAFLQKNKLTLQEAFENYFQMRFKGILNKHLD